MEPVVLRPRFGLILLPFLIPAVVLLVMRREMETPASLIYIAVLAGTGIVLAVNFRKRRIVLDEEGLTNQNLFGSYRISWAAVTKAYTKRIQQGKSRVLHLILERSSGKPFRLALALYSRNSRQELARTLIEKCPQASVNDALRDMAEGQFPWYVL